MVGRIGRTSGAFLNGRGRVWIDGREWPAEVEGGEANLRSDTPVRVLAVAGGDQLRVRGLIA
jgi:membrane protein implicated in regulation of membrane protease activity